MTKNNPLEFDEEINKLLIENFYENSADFIEKIYQIYETL
jgi:hypothetical protein